MCFNKTGIWKAAIPAALFLVFSLGCRANIGFNPKDPFFESFFEKTSLIMTEEEIKIYKFLPDEPSQQDFIKEFWAVRDPDPATEENEAQEEFEARVEYANMWFGAFNPDRGRETQRNLHSKTGWFTDRGRIYIILGPPDAMSFGRRDESIPDLRVDGYRNPMDEERFDYEGWYYERLRLTVFFVKSGWDWTLADVDPYLNDAIESAKINMIAKDSAGDPKKAFRFTAKYKDGRILVQIPVTRIAFDDKLNARFRIRINVYLNYKKLNSVEDTRTLEEKEDELLKKKNIILEIPMAVEQKGVYYFDILIQDELAGAFSKYREFVRAKI